MNRASFKALALASALAAASATCFAVPALAQQTPGNAATAQIAPAHLALGREAVNLSGIARSFNAIIPQFAAQLKGSFTTRPELTKDLDETLKTLDEEFQKQEGEMVEAAARIYALNLTQTELADIVAFFKSASGKRYVETQPRVLDGLFNEMQSWTQRLSEFMLARVRTEMKKKGHDL